MSAVIVHPACHRAKRFCQERKVPKKFCRRHRKSFSSPSCIRPKREKAFPIFSFQGRRRHVLCEGFNGTPRIFRIKKELKLSLGQKRHRKNFRVEGPVFFYDLFIMLRATNCPDAGNGRRGNFQSAVSYFFYSARGQGCAQNPGCWSPY